MTIGKKGIERLARVGSWEVDIATGKSYWSEETYRIYGITPEQFDGTYKGFLKFVHTDDIELIQKVLGNPPKEQPFDMEFRIIRFDGSIRNVYQLMEFVFDENGNPTHIYGSIQDVTEKKELEKRLENEKRKMEYMATHDELTKLPNHAYFKKQILFYLRQANQKQTTFAVMMLDIDDFKYINDALGYNLGDELIIQITKRLRTFLGDERLISRYSGDQFAIIIENLNSMEECESIAKDIMGLFKQPFKIDTYDLNVTMSMGISVYSKDLRDIGSLIKNSNLALLQAKQEGKNRYAFYSSDISIESYKQFILRNDLGKAIEKNQFELYYQPQVNLQNNEIVAVEVLIRWEHPDWGIVSPIEFISLAEETGFIIPMGNWVLRQVCSSYKQWLEGGLPAIKVSINYSSHQVNDENFVDNIKNILDEYELDPNFLVIEITKGAIMKDSEKLLSDIKRLQDLGIEVALDNFGMGFSSLSYLSSFNIDIIKLDRFFIKNFPLDEKSTTIIRFVINLARELKIKLVVEGIETWEQLIYLKRLNCYTGQGYLYSKPVAIEEFEKILAKGKCKPIVANNAKIEPLEERRKFFRIPFMQLLECDMTILKINNKSINVGNTKVLIKNIGPGGLCFVSNIKLPIREDIILEFTTELVGEELKINGHPRWTQEIDDNLYEYGIEFTADENKRTNLIRILNQVQVKMRKKINFKEGRFVVEPVTLYFKLNNIKN